MKTNGAIILYCLSVKHWIWAGTNFWRPQPTAIVKYYFSEHPPPKKKETPRKAKEATTESYAQSSEELYTLTGCKV